MSISAVVVRLSVKESEFLPQRSTKGTFDGNTFLCFFVAQLNKEGTKR